MNFVIKIGSKVKVTECSLHQKWWNRTGIVTGFADLSNIEDAVRVKMDSDGKEFYFSKAQLRLRRGFAVLDDATKHEICSKGGKSVPPERRSFSTSKNLASRAGSLGGIASAKSRSN